MAKMADYGDRVQFSLISTGPQPSYQVMNALDKKMAFDRQHHLLQPQDDEFTGVNATRVFTLDQIKARIAGTRLNPATKSTAARTARAPGSGSRATVARQEEQFAAERYEYFRAHRQTLPSTITEHTAEIAELMKEGKSAEEAFDAVIKKYF